MFALCEFATIGEQYPVENIAIGIRKSSLLREFALCKFTFCEFYCTTNCKYCDTLRLCVHIVTQYNYIVAHCDFTCFEVVFTILIPKALIGSFPNAVNRIFYVRWINDRSLEEAGFYNVDRHIVWLQFVPEIPNTSISTAALRNAQAMIKRSRST